MSTPREKAAKAGESKYYGSPCKKCANTLRYTTNDSCVDCAKGHAKAHKGRIAALLRQSKAQN